MRIRNVRPEFFMDEDLAELDPAVRLLFVGLWCLADCRGRLEDRPKRIKRQLFPSDGFDMEDALRSLVEIGCIARYEAQGKALIWIRNFTKYQFISKKEKEAGSSLPAHPDESTTIPAQSRDHPGTVPGDRTMDMGLDVGTDVMSPLKPPRKRGSRRAPRAVGGLPPPEPDRRPRVTCTRCSYEIPAGPDGNPEEHMCTEALQA